MKRVISAAVVLSALLTVSAQAQSTYVPNSGYPTNGTQNVTYTDQSNAANPYQNQTVTGTDPYAANQNPYATNQNPYAANQNPYASGDSSAVPYSSAAPYSAGLAWHPASVRTQGIRCHNQKGLMRESGLA